MRVCVCGCACVYVFLLYVLRPALGVISSLAGCAGCGGSGVTSPSDGGNPSLRTGKRSRAGCALGAEIFSHGTPRV